MKLARIASIVFVILASGISQAQSHEAEMLLADAQYKMNDWSRSKFFHCGNDKSTFFTRERNRYNNELLTMTYQFYGNRFAEVVAESLSEIERLNGVEFKGKMQIRITRQRDQHLRAKEPSEWVPRKDAIIIRITKKKGTWKISDGEWDQYRACRCDQIPQGLLR